MIKVVSKLQFSTPLPTMVLSMPLTEVFCFALVIPIRLASIFPILLYLCTKRESDTTWAKNFHWGCKIFEA